MATNYNKILDEDRVKQLWAKIKAKFVAQETGKGLSSNDFTDSYKNKVDSAYSKPSTGIPKTDLASSVQTSLGKADTALQSYTETDPIYSASPAAGIKSTDITNWNSKGTYSKPSTGIPKTDLASAVQTSLGKADTALQSYTETDPVFSASAAAGITATDISNWNKAEQNVQADWNTTSTSADSYIKNKPTSLASFSNDTTKFQNETQVQSLIDNSIKDITGIDFQIVTSLPTTGKKGTIYLIAIGGGGETQNVYEEYIWITTSSGGSYELLGTTQVDISNCVKYSDITVMTEAELNDICV